MEIRESWINLLHRVATGTRKTRTIMTPVGVLIFGIFTFMFLIAGVTVDRFFHLPPLFPEQWRLPVSLPVTATGIFGIVWSALHFLKVRGTPVPFNPPPKLVDTGPYRYVRNPMVTGVILSLFGIGAAINSISIVCLFTPLYILVNVWELKSIEEPELVRRLGDPYIKYRRKTPMFFPRLKK
jgi:protein-S-isoprenylcysteine O-methyltransferase Ste14